jgi:glycine cleavage system aminomethyltransferase T
MKHYLLSEQDLDEIIWDLEYKLWLAIDKIRDKFIHEAAEEEEEEEEKADD